MKWLIPFFFPCALLAGDFIVTVPAPVSQPLGTIDRVNLRTQTSVTFQDSVHFNRGQYRIGNFVTSISAEPIHYKDSTGVWQRFKFDETASTVPGFDNAVKVGRFTIDYSTAKPGKIRYSRKNAFMEFDPAFDTAAVGVEFNVTSRGLKATYKVDAGTRLAWGYDYTATYEKEGIKGKGKLKDNAGLIRAELSEFTGRDALNQPVLVTAIYTADSLIVTWPEGYTYPVEIDPTFVDTAVAATSKLYYVNSTVWATARNTTTGTIETTLGAYKLASNYFIARGFFSFPLTGLSAATVDSARFLETLGIGEAIGGGGVYYICQGTFSGAPATSWYNDFTGWSASDIAFSLTLFAADSLPLNGVGNFSKIFNATGVSAITAKWGTDTLRVALIERNDNADVAQENANYNLISNMPVLTIYYNSLGPSAIVGAVDGSAVKMGAIDGSNIETIGGIP